MLIFGRLAGNLILKHSDPIQWVFIGPTLALSWCMDNAIKRFLTLIIVITSIIGCGETESDRQNLSNSTNIFFDSADTLNQAQDFKQIFGLWESDVYNDDDLKKQVRWLITDTYTILAKKCITQDNHVVYAQVRIDFENTSRASEMNAFEIPVNQTTKITDISLLPGNKFCRISIDMSETPNKAIIESDTHEFELFDSDFQDGVMELFFLEDRHQGSFKKIAL